MHIDLDAEAADWMAGGVGDVVSNVAAGISAKVKQKYGSIDLAKVPDHVNYSKVEKYLRSVNVEVTRRMFISYLNENLLPDGHEVKNSNYSFYTREQVIYYILIDMFKPILPLGKVKVLFSEILSPVISEIGLDAAFSALCEIIVYMTGRFEEAVKSAISEENLKTGTLPLQGKRALSEKATYDVRHYTNLVTLCMARGALDFYKFSPFTLLD
ncbi:MAG TPA: hypothetical protein VLA21_09365 [Candidatus Limnocylindria bacterium]|nr:hypothetical protein [Candidatus Limnocylindria bacterium]